MSNRIPRPAPVARTLVLALLAAPLLAAHGNDAGAQATPGASVPPTATIVLGEAVAIDGEGASAGADGVTITTGGTFAISGDLAGGMVEVDAPGAAVELVLAGASIANADGPAVLVRDAAAATVTLAAGSVNSLADAGDTDFDAALYSDAPLTIRGDGALTVEGNQNEGISTTSHITIDGGTIRVRAVEDGLNANQDDVSEIAITGGSLFVETESGDGIDSNGTIAITGGTVIALGALDDANGGLDADGPVTIDGGLVVATGARQQAPDDASAQRSLFVAFEREQPASTLVVVRDAAGADLLAVAPAVPFRHLLVSDPRLADGVSYTVSTGGAADGPTDDGRFTGPVTDPGTPVATVTTASVQDARSRPPRQ